MSKLGNKDLAKILMDKFDLSRVAAEEFVSNVFDVINEGLRNDKQVKVKGLGTFKVTAVAPRKSVDVNTGEPIIIEGRDKINFTADTPMRDLVNRPFAQFETVVVNEGVDFDEIDRKFANGLPEHDTTELPDDVDDTEEDEADEMLTEISSAEIENAAEVVSKDESDVTPAMVNSESSKDAPVGNSDEVVEEKAAAVLVLDSEALKMLNGQAPTVSVSQDDHQEDTRTAPNDKTEVGAEEQEDRQEDVSDSQEAEGGETPLVLTPDEFQVPEGGQERSDDTEEAMSVAAAVILSEPISTSSEMSSSSPELTSQSGDEATEREQETLTIIEENTKALHDKVAKQQKLLTAMLAVAVILVLVCLAGIGYMGWQLNLRNHRIQHLEAQADWNKHHAAKVTPMVSDKNKAAEREPIDSKTTAAATVDPAMEIVRDDEQQAASAQAKPAASDEKVSETATKQEKLKAETETKVSESKTLKDKDKPSDNVPLTDYNKDIRIRTGGYKIVGISKVVTVKKGQTLSSISKSYFGPGMECYVEAVNGGKTSFAVGEKINIPELKIKRK